MDLSPKFPEKTLAFFIYYNKITRDNITTNGLTAHKKDSKVGTCFDSPWNI